MHRLLVFFVRQDITDVTKNKKIRRQDTQLQERIKFGEKKKTLLTELQGWYKLPERN